jgi:hypothetical protein
MGFDLMEVGEIVLRGMHDASTTIVENMRSPIPYVSGAVGVLIGVLIACLSGKVKIEPPVQ